MKKLLCTLALMACVTLSAAAADVGTIRNGYPGDTEAQAQMLHELGLFRGTEKGFELEKPMTRAEAAAMLTRFLGAEQKALAGTWQHPFTDVPSWADKYVGWLYESGLTRGVSATLYGAEENVTCGQYCTFLARAARDEDGYTFLLQYDDYEYHKEVRLCDEAGFVRGDAVSLSTRLLGEYYTKYEDLNGLSMAYKLIDEGVFTKEQLKNAAWDVLPRQYRYAALHGSDMDYALSCVIADVPVLRNEETDATVVYAEDRPLNQMYGVSHQEDQPCILYTIDPATLETLEIARFDDCNGVFGIGKSGQTDFLVTESWAREGAAPALIAVRGNAVRKLEIPLSDEDASALRGANSRSDKDTVVVFTKENAYVLEESGVRALPISREGELLALYDGCIVTQQVDAEQTVIQCWSTEGKRTDEYILNNDCPIDYTEHDRDWWTLFYALQLDRQNGEYLWGSAGLYRIENGRLTQVTSRAVYDWAVDPADGSYVLVTHQKGKRVIYTESAVSYQTGDTLVRLQADGTEIPLLPDLPENSLLLDQIAGAENGLVQFTSMISTEPRHMGNFFYQLENGHVTVLKATRDILYTRGEDAISNEQKRLDELGIGVGA